MTSAPGNKSLIAWPIICMVVIALLFGEILAAKKSRLNFYQRKYSDVVSSLELKNQEAVNSSGISNKENSSQKKALEIIKK